MTLENIMSDPSIKTCFHLPPNTVCLHHMAVIPPLQPVQALGVKQMAACCFTLLCALALWCCLSIISKWNYFLWNNALSARLSNIFLSQCSFYIACDELMLSSIGLKHNATFWLDQDPNRLPCIRDQDQKNHILVFLTTHLLCLIVDNVIYRA